jgi:Mg2+/Co2+ transporter CorB
LDDNYLLLRFALLGILLIISAFFSASEVALFSLNPVQLAELKEKSGRLGKLVNRLLEKPHLHW